MKLSVRSNLTRGVRFFAMGWCLLVPVSEVLFSALPEFGLSEGFKLSVADFIAMTCLEFPIPIGSHPPWGIEGCRLAHLVSECLSCLFFEVLFPFLAYEDSTPTSPTVSVLEDQSVAFGGFVVWRYTEIGYEGDSARIVVSHYYSLFDEFGGRHGFSSSWFRFWGRGGSRSRRRFRPNSGWWSAAFRPT